MQALGLDENTQHTYIAGTQHEAQPVPDFFNKHKKLCAACKSGGRGKNL